MKKNAVKLVKLFFPEGVLHEKKSEVLLSLHILGTGAHLHWNVIGSNVWFVTMKKIDESVLYDMVQRGKLERTQVDIMTYDRAFKMGFITDSKAPSLFPD